MSMPYLITSPDWGAIIGWLAGHGPRILLILALLFLADQLLRRLVPPAVRVAVARQMAGKPEEEISQRADTLIHIFQRTGWTVALALAILTILPELGINVTALLAGLGIGGIALGFGAQSLVRDIIHGIFILAENQYSKGDVVRVAGVAGLVEEVGLRRTVLRDLDGIVHYIPNGEIRIASNFTKEWSRVNMNVSVAYGEDLDRVIEVINRVGQELAQDPEWGPLILKPPQVLRVDAFEESGIAIKILGDTVPIRQWDVMGELRRRLKAAFDAEGIEIPFPHRVLVTRGAKATQRPQRREV